MRRVRTIVAVLAFTLAVVSHADADSILFAHVGSSLPQYYSNGLELAGYLAAAGHTVTVVDLEVTLLQSLGLFSQVWVYDLSAALDTNAIEVQNYHSIAGWYNGLTNQNLIADARIVSSSKMFTDLSGVAPESSWIQNYATQLSAAGGGLVLGTDHSSFQSGINTINQLIGINQFSGVTFTGNGQEAQVAPTSALYTAGLLPCDFSFSSGACVNANSSGGFAPLNTQPNGQVLLPAAFYNFVNVAISTTLRTAQGPPNPPPTTVPEPTSLLLLGSGLAGLLLAERRHRRGGAA